MAPQRPPLSTPHGGHGSSDQRTGTGNNNPDRRNSTTSRGATSGEVDGRSGVRDSSSLTLSIRRPNTSPPQDEAPPPQRQRVWKASCCSCTRHATCCATVATNRTPACECRVAGRHCYGCAALRTKCKNKALPSDELLALTGGPTRRQSLLADAFASGRSLVCAPTARPDQGRSGDNSGITGGTTSTAASNNNSNNSGSGGGRHNNASGEPANDSTSPTPTQTDVRATRADGGAAPSANGGRSDVLALADGGTQEFLLTQPGPDTTTIVRADGGHEAGSENPTQPCATGGGASADEAGRGSRGGADVNGGTAQGPDSGPNSCGENGAPAGGGIATDVAAAVDGAPVNMEDTPLDEATPADQGDPLPPGSGEEEQGGSQHALLLTQNSTVRAPTPPPGDQNPFQPTAPTIPNIMEPGADLPGYQPTPADTRLAAVLGDHPHQNDGCQLDGGIPTDRFWQRCWKRSAQLALSHYDAPRGLVGRRFVCLLANELQGVLDRTWNSERPLVFASVVLQKSRTCRSAGDIRRRLTHRMDLWERGSWLALVDDTEAEVLGQVGSGRRPTDDETAARSYNAKVLSGRLRPAVRQLTSRGGGGVMQPDDLCTKTQRPVLTVLRGKHPKMRGPPVRGDDPRAFEPYPHLPDPVPLVISEETVGKVAAKLAPPARAAWTPLR